MRRILTVLSVLLPVAAVALAGAPAEPPTLVQRLCAAYRDIETLSGEIRKTTTGGGRTVRLLSRVHFAKPNRVHVESLTSWPPSTRRIIVDGTRLYYHEKGLERGFSTPVSALTGPWLDAARNIPGTPMEHLLKIENAAEHPLPPTEAYPVRAAYQADNVVAVLSCDPAGRLVLIEFFKTLAMEEKTAEYRYDAFRKVRDDCWIPCRHEGTVYLPGGKSLTERRLIDNLAVNAPVAPKLFDANVFFKDVEFVDDFDKTYAR